MSSENPSPPSPDQDPAGVPLSVEAKDVLRDVLAIDRLEEWRQQQHEALTRLREAASSDITDTSYIDEFNKSIDDSLRQYLEQNGLESTDSNYQQTFDLYRQCSIDKVRDDEWLTSPASRGGDVTDRVSGREKTARVLKDKANRLTGDEQDVTEETTVERLNKSREAKHTAYVKRLKGPLFGKKRSENDQAYKQAMLEYRDVLGERLEERIAELHDEGKTEDEIKEFIKQQANQFARDDEAAQKAELVDKSGRLGTWLERYANADRKTKILYGLGLGAVAAATGVGAGLLVGAAFGVVGGATLAGMATTGSGLAWKGFGAFRTYHLRRADIFKSDNLPEFELKDGATSEGERRRMLEFLHDTSEAQLKKGERIKKMAMGFALGSVALGTTVGLGVHAALADGGWENWSTHWQGGQTQHWWEQAQNHPATNLPDNQGGHVGGDLTPIKPPIEAQHPGASKADVLKDYLQEHAAARKIDSGEGWNQTMKELGVKSKDWHELLQEVGPKLHNVRYGGVRAAYWDNSAHEWRINMTENGKMSPEALKVLVEQANDKGYLKHGLDFSGGESSVPSGETSTGLHGVKLWNGAAPEQVLQKAYPGLSSRQAYFDINNLYDKLGPKNVFEQVTLSEHGDHNIWLDQNTGTAKLTPEAQTLWNQMHTEDKVLTQAIAEGRVSGIDIVTHGERWATVIDKLKQAGITDVSKNKYDSVLHQLWPQIKNLEYSDGTHVAELNRHGQLIMNESPTRVLHPEALKRLARLLYKNNYGLAA